MPSSTASPNIMQRVMSAINHAQIRHRAIGFTYAVIKKYGDDNASYQAALLTYYGFLSLFPLLIVATSLANIIAQHNAALREKLLSGFNTYFPIVGSQLQANVHHSAQTGVALLIGLVITFYGAKGVADAVQYALNQLWQIPRAEQPSFPKAPLISLSLLAGGGIGLLTAAILSGIATALGHSPVLAVLSTVISIVILFSVFSFLMVIGTASRYSFADNLIGALLAAFAIQALETIGGYLITHQLHNLQGAYGQFALVLAILFWLYLQAEIFLYAIEINTVSVHKLWPRSLISRTPTKADRRAQQLYARKERLQDTPPESSSQK